MEKRKLRMAMIGIGVGGAEILPAMDVMDEIDLVAGCDINPVTRERFVERYKGAKAYATVEELCKDPNVEAVWISTPNQFHAPHTIIAANHGKHVVVEKPMALNLQEAEAMVAAAEKNNIKLLAGHTRSFTPPIQAMRKVITSGRLGKLCAINLFAYTDWMLRPRSPQELDPNQGGGVPYRQAPHQVDTVRLLGGGKVRSVRGMTGQWMPERPIPGYYTAYIEFEDGTPANITHNGYGYYIGAQMVAWGEDKHQYDAQGRVDIRKAIRAGKRDEEAEKQDRRIGGKLEQIVFRRSEPEPWVPEDLGMTIVSCERGDIRHSKHGIFIHDDEGVHDIDLGLATKELGPSLRRDELEEFYEGLVFGKPLYHDGRWGLATLEVCLAIMQSGKERKEIMLKHQVGINPAYDAYINERIEF
ncbi:MAG: Gfo/Idh/MocA family oxidoreductase [Dehalococcoidia bacterium]|nr:Gfo/Idh/MocA family oxidoreductase [Dehalococcoidia bacterium]